MKLIRGFHNAKPQDRGCVATIGAFDGVHLGHQAVMRQLQRHGRELDLPCAVILFEPLPREYFSPDSAPARLMSFGEKCRALADLGVDQVLRIRFDESLRNMGPQAFINKVFVESLGARFIVVGDDFRFGRDRSGDFDLLKKVAPELGFEVRDTETFTIDGERVSSTRIREVLANSDFALAEKLLGRPYSITGRVIVGKQLGRTLNAPTANIQLHRLRSPLLGVFAVDVEFDGKRHHGVANVGVRPTVNKLTKAILEVHLLDFSGDLYRKQLKVTFRHKLREEVKFDGVEALKAQIAKDIDSARAYFES